MQLKYPVTIAQLDILYSESVAKVKTERDFYSRGKGEWRIGTYTARVFAFAGLFIGVAAPLTPSWTAKLEAGSEIGYVALALAGLILALDQVFVLSQTWIRYRNAEMRLNTLIAEAEYKWMRLRSSLTDDSGAHERREEALTLCEKLVMDARRVVEEETEKWGSQIEAAGTRLGVLLKEQSDIVEKLKKEDEAVRKARMDAASEQASNGVSLEISEFKKLDGAVTARLAEQTEERGQPVSRIVFEGIPLGQHKLVVEGKMKDETAGRFRWESLELIEKGKPQKVLIEVK